LSRLAGAMQSIVDAERLRMVDATEERRRSDLDQLRQRDAAGEESLRTVAATGAESINTWVAAETERIKHEDERRRKEIDDDLQARLTRHRSTFDGATEAVETAVAAYRAELDAYFSRLEGVDDPVVIAEQALRRPVYGGVDETTLGETAGVNEQGQVGVMDLATEGQPLVAWATPAGSASGPAPSVASDDEHVGGTVGPQPPGGPAELIPDQPTGLPHNVPVVHPASNWLRRNPVDVDPPPADSNDAVEASCPDCWSSLARGVMFCRSCGREWGSPRPPRSSQEPGSDERTQRAGSRVIVRRCLSLVLTEWVMAPIRT